MAIQSSNPIAYQCCFCAQAIENVQPEPLLLTLAVDEDGEQVLHTHYACLKKALHPSVPLFVWSTESE